MAWSKELIQAWEDTVTADGFSGFDELSEAFEAGWNAALKSVEAGQQRPTSAMPKCPAPVPCEHVAPNGDCGKVPKCFSRYGTSA